MGLAYLTRFSVVWPPAFWQQQVSDLLMVLHEVIVSTTAPDSATVSRDSDFMDRIVEAEFAARHKISDELIMLFLRMEQRAGFGLVRRICL
jgi:hypothetical protein